MSEEGMRHLSIHRTHLAYVTYLIRVLEGFGKGVTLLKFARGGHWHKQSRPVLCHHAVGRQKEMGDGLIEGLSNGLVWLVAPAWGARWSEQMRCPIPWTR